mmetsp:Transcript_29364/g.62474  ORF Transcript_29364/g.62474 Transcript_29364/m.62474 type:complete len:358 (+) Transcript_29364:76-1149(+)
MLRNMVGQQPQTIQEQSPPTVIMVGEEVGRRNELGEHLQGDQHSNGNPLPVASVVGQGVNSYMPNLTFDGSEIVLGVPIDNTGITRSTSRVIILASIAATFYIVRFIVNLLSDTSDELATNSDQRTTSVMSLCSSLLIELSVPACGYFGALYSNRQLTCCFCSCNLFTAVVAILTCVRDNIRVSELDSQCEREPNIQQRRRCEAWTSDGMAKYSLIVSSSLIFVIGCVTFWYGHVLYHRLSGDYWLAQTPQVGEVIDLFSPNSGENSRDPRDPRELVASGNTVAAPSESPTGTADSARVATATGSTRVWSAELSGQPAQGMAGVRATAQTDPRGIIVAGGVVVSPEAGVDASRAVQS